MTLPEFSFVVLFWSVVIICTFIGGVVVPEYFEKDDE